MQDAGYNPGKSNTALGHTMRRYIIAFVMLCMTVATAPNPVINPDNVAPSDWFTPIQTQKH